MEIKIEFTDLQITLKCADTRESIVDTYIILGILLAKFREWKHGNPKVKENGEKMKPLK